MIAMPRARVRVFISAKSDDYDYADAVYRHLAGAGVATFFSRESLPELGVADYRREIDRALDEADHLIVVTSSADRVVAPWVEAEWGFFINEKRSGRKHGNLVTVVVGTLQPAELPPSLRYYEVIPFDPGSLDRLLRYVHDPGAGIQTAPAAAARTAGRSAPFREVATFGGPPGVSIMRAGAGQSLIATGGFDGAVRLYDTATRTRQAVLGSARYWSAGHEGPMTALEFSPDGARLASGHLDGSVRVWELGDRQELGAALMHDLAISGLAWSIDGRTLTTSSKDGVIKHCALAAWKDGAAAAGQRTPAPVVSMTCVRDTGWLIIGMINMATRRYVIQVQDGGSPHEVLATLGAPESFTMLAMSSDGRILAAGSHDGVARLYDFEAVADAIAQRKSPRSLPPLMDLRAHKKPLSSIAFFPESRRAVTCAMETTLIVWDLQSGAPVVTLQGQAGEEFVSAAALDGTSLVAALADGRLRLWEQSQ